MKGVPSEFHESVIDSMVSKHGYRREGFAAFLSLSLFIDDEIELQEMYESLNQMSYMQTKRHVKEFMSWKTEPLVVDWLCEEIQPKNVNGFISKYLRIMPDCWRYKDGKIEIYEVFTSGRCDWYKLSKAALIDDLLYQNGNKARLSLIEHHTYGAIDVTHDLDIVFDWLEMSGLLGCLGDELRIDETEQKEALQLYFSILNESKQPLPTISLAETKYILDRFYSSIYTNQSPPSETPKATIA